jgi:RNA polymerase sigma factor (sigma-70 family)
MVDLRGGAAAQLFETYGERLTRRARRILRSEHEADDAVQEVMLSVLEAPHVLPNIENLLGWLYTLVRRRCVDIIRSDVSRKAREEAAAGMELLFTGATGPATLVEEEEVAGLVAEAIDRLPASQRYAFVTNTIDGMTFREMSARTGVPMGTLMARKKRAVESIRRYLARHGILEEVEGTS